MESRAVDWEMIHRRLEATAIAVEGSLDRSPEEERRILEMRARMLAKAPAAQEQVERLEILAFSLASETYGIETQYVCEVCQLRELTVLPGTPSFIAGIMSLHGRILAVVDLRKLFDLPSAGLTELNRIVVLKGAQSEFGLLADAVHGIRSVITSELQEGLPTLMGIREKFLKGITGQSLAVLDGMRVLSDAELKVGANTGTKQ